jgi:hypothetical protein
MFFKVSNFFETYLRKRYPTSELISNKKKYKKNVFTKNVFFKESFKNLLKLTWNISIHTGTDFLQQKYKKNILTLKNFF